MKVIDFIKWTEDNEWPNGLKDPWAERIKLLNPKHKIIIPKDDIKEFANKNNISKEDAKKQLEEENNKEPVWLDEKKADEWVKIGDECDKALREYIIEHKIFYTDYDHQSLDFNGVPILENDNGDKFVATYTLRSWGGLMADCWNEILNIDTLCYLDIYCGGTPDEIKDYLDKEKK